MAIIVNAGTILTEGGAIATSTDCCCDTSCEYELCDPTSIKYCECDDPGTCIFVDPAVLSGLNPPPGTIEISGTCYEYVEKSLTAIDAFSIDSEPVDCDEPVCDVIDCLDCSGCPPVTLTASGFVPGVGPCNFTLNPNGVYTMLPTANPCEFSGTAPGASGFAIISCAGAGNWTGILLVGTPSLKPTFTGSTPSSCPQGVPYAVNFGCAGSIVVS